MSDPSEFTMKFCARVKELRTRRGWTQATAAMALGDSLDNWKKYETRTPLPHALCMRFAVAVDVSMEDLFDVDKPLPKRRSRSA